MSDWEGSFALESIRRPVSKRLWKGVTSTLAIRAAASCYDAGLHNCRAGLLPQLLSVFVYISVTISKETSLRYRVALAYSPTTPKNFLRLAPESSTDKDG